MNNRILAYVLIVLGLMILIGKWLTFGTIVALIMIVFGVKKIQEAEGKLGYLLTGIGAAILLLEHLVLFLVIAIGSLVLFYYRSRSIQTNDHVVKRHSFTSRLKWDREPYQMANQSLFHIIGESDIDLSLAILDGKETTLMFQGVMGDMDIMLPDDLGVEIEATVLFGQIDVGRDREMGFFNRWKWRSPNYDYADQRVKLNISYLVGDIDIRMH